MWLFFFVFFYGNVQFFFSKFPKRVRPLPEQVSDVRKVIFFCREEVGIKSKFSVFFFLPSPPIHTIRMTRVWRECVFPSVGARVCDRRSHVAGERRRLSRRVRASSPRRDAEPRSPEITPRSCYTCNVFCIHENIGWLI